MPLAPACRYCGEDLPRQWSSNLPWAIPAALAPITTAVCVALRGVPRVPSGLTLPEAALLALATGLLLLPPSMPRGVDGATPGERLRFALARFLGGIVLALLTALLLLAAFGSPRPWTVPAAILGVVAALSLSILPPLLEISWLKLAAGALLAAGLLWAQS